MKRILSLRSLAAAGALAVLGVADLSAQTPAVPAPTQEAAAAPRQEQSNRRREPRLRRNEISQEEMVQSGATNLYDVVQRLRPQWLTGTSASNIGGGGQAIVVYQNNTQLGGLDALRQMSPGYAEVLRFLDGSEASNTLPGLGSRRVGGAIIVVTPGNNR
ncbi:MAG TPA: hypothetical protein VFR37_14815 [Longimicrobium sp.]|nr:hypothetical protein [Longimicrobium sp.]